MKKWNGFRLLAIDGSEAVLPKTEETVREFGEYTTNFMNKTVVLARISKAHDVLNKITIDAQLTNRKVGEHALANQHLEYFGQGDLVLLDRGYPSFDLFRNILATGSHFCARLAVPNWRKAKELIESGQKEVISEIKPGHELLARYRKEGIEVSPVKCRFVCIDLPTGEKEVLVTSLLDTEFYPYNVFQSLYHQRWDIEESYKKDKHRLQLENFSGKSTIAIYQDFYAKILLENLTSILSSGLEKEIQENKKSTKYGYQVNFTTALAKVKETLALIFNSANVIGILQKLIKMFLDNILPIRPGRSFERKKGKRRRYHKCYLSL